MATAAPAVTPATLCDATDSLFAPRILFAGRLAPGA